MSYLGNKSVFHPYIVCGVHTHPRTDKISLTDCLYSFSLELFKLSAKSVPNFAA